LDDLEPTLIRSKLQRPTPAGLLHRPRICGALQEGLERKLTLISAPAGYGKTSALVDFAQHTSVPVCWYTVDERDRDLSLFIRYIVGAIHEQFPQFGEGTRDAVASRRDSLFREPTAVVGNLVNEMLDLKESFVLVIDNFEPVDGALGVSEFLRRLLEVLPSNCHVMMGSRVLPGVPVTQLVAKRQLVGLTERDVRFRPDEIRELLRRSHVEVSPAQARAIADNAEGWITGVLLILDLLRRDADAGLLDADKATTQTYGYLASEVLERQPPDVRQFLYSSSILREMSARLCRDVLGIEGAHSLLTEVGRRNLFLTRFGSERTAAYRYHKLFRDFLQGRLRGGEPDLYEELHRRAGAWFEREHDVEEAVYHYVAAQAYGNATALMERAAMECFHRGRLETLSRWAESLPEQARSQAPRLLLYYGKALTDRYDYERAREALAYAESGFAARGDSTSLARVRNQKATLALFESRYESVLREAHRALEILDPGESAERAQAQRMIGNAEIGLGRFAAGAVELEKALRLYREMDSPYDVLNLLQDMASAFASHGHLDLAAEHLGEALPLARRLGSARQLAGVLNNLGWLRHALGEYREALALYQEGLAAARRGNDPRSEGNIAEGMATLYRNLGNYRRAEMLYDVAWRIASGSRPGLTVLILVARADMYRWQGNCARAPMLIERARGLAEQHELNAQRQGVLRISEGIALAESGNHALGLEQLSRGLAFLREQGAKRDLARGHFLKARAHVLAGEEEQALGELRHALDLAQDMGTDQFAVIEGRHARDVLELGAAEGIETCDDLLSRADGLPDLRRALLEIGGEPDRSASDEHLEIYAFGGGRVVRDGRLIPSSAWQAAMAKELFFYVLLHGPVERDVVGAIFWPDLPAEKMSNNFHSTLYRVRKALSRDAVVVTNGKYGLGVDYWFDLEAFETLVERARLLPPRDWQARDLWERAVELCTGDFLPEVDRAWCVPKREEIRETYVEALIELGRCCGAHDQFEEAVDWYRRALEEDELREDVHRRIMRAYVELGRRSEALAQYRECREILRRELDVGPSRETKRLYQEVAGKVPG
jgi:ATP/maltotriose-dependent transcriptional regulator MalT/two-component SAPR family response regulator